jgi:hypothetical protein
MKRLLMLLSAGAIIATAAPAYADPSGNDSAFLKQLNDAGRTYQDPGAAVSAAKTVCDLVSSGTPDKEIVSDLAERNPSFKGDAAAKFKDIAASAYCPK